MPANTQPIFPETPRMEVASISTANTNRTTTATTGLTQLIAAGIDGTRVDEIDIKATGTTTAGMVRLWRYTGSGNALLIDEYPISAVTPSGTVAAFQATYTYKNLVLPAAHSLWVSTHNAEAFNVVVNGGDY